MFGPELHDTSPTAPAPTPCEHGPSQRRGGMPMWVWDVHDGVQASHTRPHITETQAGRPCGPMWYANGGIRMTYRKTSALLLLTLSACGDDVTSPGATDGSTGGSSTTGTSASTGIDTTTSESADGSSSSGVADVTTGGDETTTTGGSACGDGAVGGGEACDDGNTDNDDGCSDACEVEEGYACDDAEPSVCAVECGDGLIRGAEACDDGNTDADDGCSDACELETGFTCDDAEPTVCTADCGDGMIVGAEECDDADLENDDGCSDTCTVEEGWACDMEPSVCEAGCGDGIVVGMEECDDGGFDPDDGCSARCTVELGWVCDDSSPTACMEDCGDGMIVGAEECDDAGTDPDDGCSDVCEVESGFVCEGEPSVCVTACGDGSVGGTEACDDGNLAQGDGCDALCQIEFPFSCSGDPSACTIAETLDTVTLGGEGGCVLTVSGTVACFGNGSEGEIGNGTIDVETFLPVAVFENATQVTSGDEHTCAIDGAGDVFCWGDNANTQMGPLSTPPTDVSTPLQVTGLASIVEVEAGDDHNCAIDDTGTVWCWGDNDNRQLGRGGTNSTDDPTPAAVSLPLPAIDLGLGQNHSCAVLNDNTVRCWGDDDSGQLGDGTLGTDSGDPVTVITLSNIVDVDAGRDTTCALDDVGAVFCWGNNNDGEVGDGTTNDIATPQPIALAAAADAISLGSNFSCALLATDDVYCWGDGSDFQLGYGNLIDQSSPVQVVDMPAGDIVDIEAGARGMCAVFATNERYCWGYSEEGQLGMAPINQLDLTDPLPFSGPVVEVTLTPTEYRGNTCGVLGDGTVECAGDGTNVTLSTVTGAASIFNGITRHLPSLTQNPGLTDVQTLAIGDGSICFATSTDVQCFGDNSQLQMGQGGASTTDLASPTAVPGLGAVDELAAGDQFYCVRTGGTVQCWGDNDNRQTGVDNTTDQSVPVTVPVIADATSIGAGENHACALRAGGVVSCWGDDGLGQLGDNDGNTADSATPVDVTGLPGAASQLVVGQDHACALVGTDVYCWGDALHGQLGQGDNVDSDTALLVPGLPQIVQIASGFNYVCAIDDTADMWCWGYGLDGQLGNGGIELTGLEDFTSPVLFQVASGITDVACGNSHTCVETAMGWQCVGFRSSGQLANGTTLEPSVPTGMLFGI